MIVPMRNEAHGIGIVGAGQLARMTIQAASALGIDSVVLASGPDDAATQLALGAGRPQRGPHV